jgi:hypothetical protein
MGDICWSVYIFQFCFKQMHSYNSSWEAAISWTEIPRTLSNPKFHYRLYKSPPFVPLRGQMNPIHDLPSHLFKNHFIIILPCSLVLPSCHFASLPPRTTKNNLITSGFPTKTLYAFLFSPVLDTFCAVPLLLAVSVYFSLAACYFLLVRNALQHCSFLGVKTA